MKTLTLAITLLLCLTFFSHMSAQEIQETQEETLKLIEIRMAHLDDIPKENPLLGSEINIRFELSRELPIHFFQALVNDKFLFGRAAYISQVKEIVSIRKGFSKAYQARAAFIAPIVPSTSDKLKLSGLGVELKIVNLNIEVMNDPSLLKIQKPQIMTMKYQEQVDYSKMLYIAGFVLSILSIIGIYLWLRLKERRSEDVYKQKWVSFILKAKTRSDFEKIYLLRRRWKEVLGLSASEVNSFSRVINKYQYQEEWGSDEVSFVESSLQTIIKNYQKGGK